MSQTLPPVITWDDSWSVGLKELDDDHKQLVHILETLFGALISAQGSEYIQRVVKDLLAYTEYHFQHEERLLAECDYPDLDAHQQCHRELFQQVTEYCRRIQNHQATEALSDEVYEFLKQWLVDHILEKDFLYKPYLS